MNHSLVSRRKLQLAGVLGLILSLLVLATPSVAEPSGPRAFQGHIWLDEDESRTEDAGEVRVPGATVQLLWAGPDNNFQDSADNDQVTLITDSNGEWSYFGALGAYIVIVNFPEANYGITTNPDNAQFLGMNTYEFIAYEDYVQPPINFGVAPQKLSGIAWIDDNADNVVDPAEERLEYVWVRINGFGPDGIQNTNDDTYRNLPRIRTSYLYLPDFGGRWQYGVTPGIYEVTVDLQGSPYETRGVYSAGPQIVTVGPNEAAPELKFPFTRQTVSGQLWWDTDEDGVRDPAERPKVNVQGMVQMFGTDGVEGGGDAEASFTTDSNGFYSVDTLPGDGIARVFTNGFPTYDPDGVDTPSETRITVPTGGALENQDFGFAPRIQLDSVIWNDVNNNGLEEQEIYDEDTGESIPGERNYRLARRVPRDVQMNLRRANGTLVGSSNGDRDGKALIYGFSNLEQGDYYLEIPAGQFAPGGPLENWDVTDVVFSDPTVNEQFDANGVEQPDGSLRTGDFNLSYQWDSDLETYVVAGAPNASSELSFYGVQFGVTGPELELTVVKLTNGQVSTGEPGTLVKPNSPVVWEYRITNNTAEPLVNLRLDDNREGEHQLSTIEFPDENNNYTYQFASAPGVEESVYEPFDYDQNCFGSGSETRMQLKSPKDKIGRTYSRGVGPPGTQAGIMEVGDTWTFKLTGTTSYDQYHNTVNVIGDFVCGVSSPVERQAAKGKNKELNGPILLRGPVGDNSFEGDGEAWYFGIDPGVAVKKFVNGDDADTSPGATLAAGSTVNHSYLVTNDGTLDQTFTVTDSTVPSSAIQCGQGTGNVLTLAPFEEVTCTATTVAVSGQSGSIGTASGTGPATFNELGEEVPGDALTASDPAYYNVDGAPPVGNPEVNLTKYLEDDDANTPPGVPVVPNNSMTARFNLLNSGDTYLADFSLSDDVISLSGVTCEIAGTPVLLSALVLSPGGEAICVVEAPSPGPGELHTSVGTITAKDFDPVAGTLGSTVTDTDPANATGIQPLQLPAAGGSGSQPFWIFGSLLLGLVILGLASIRFTKKTRLSI